MFPVKSNETSRRSNASEVSPVDGVAQRMEEGTCVCDEEKGDETGKSETTDNSSGDIQFLPTQSISGSDDEDGDSLSSGSLNADMDSYGDDLLHRTIADAGRWAYGTILVEAWLLGSDGMTLHRPRGAWWIDPVFHSEYHSLRPVDRDLTSGSSRRNLTEESGRLESVSSLTNCHFSKSKADLPEQHELAACPICRLTDHTRPDYFSPAPVVPGQELPGVLWADHNGPENIFCQYERRGAWHLKTGNSSRRGGNISRRLNYREHSSHSVATHKVVWRNVNSLASDPDLPWNPRLQHMAAMGLGWAASVPLVEDGRTIGIVIYMARQGVDLGRLQDPKNERYLVAASSFISGALCVRRTRQEVVMQRQEEFKASRRALLAQILRARASGIPLDELVHQNSKKVKDDDDEQPKAMHNSFPQFEDYDGFKGFMRFHWDAFIHICTSGFRTTKNIAVHVARKSRGAKVEPPPALSWSESMLTLCASLVAILMVMSINKAFTTAYGRDFGMPMGPFGALAALVFGLTAAPASQPRNVILGQTLATTVAMILNNIPQTVWSGELRVSVTVALVISLMVKFGVTHPPAAAAALTIASNPSAKWTSVAIFLMTNLLVIFLASMINNVSPKRQYPTYWGIGSMKKKTVKKLQ